MLRADALRTDARRPNRDGTAVMASCIGMLLAAAVTALTARADTTHAWMHAAPWLVLIGLVVGVIAVLLQRKAKHIAPAAGVRQKYKTGKS